MSEIKTVLNFFDKNNGLKAVLKDLKSIKKLQAEINNQKGGVSSDNLKERTAALKEITRLQKQLDAQRKKAINTGKQAVGIEKELVKVQEQDRKVKKQLKVARTEKFRQLQETNLALRNQKKLVKADIVENSKLSSVYERQSAKLNRLRKELKNLILTEGEGSAKTKKLALEVGKLDTKLKKADAAAGQFQRNVGNYPNALRGAIGSLKNFAGALGITAGIAGVVAALKGAFTTFKDFEKSLSNLSSITGATGKDLEFYKEQAIAIGSSTTLSASQTVEAFKLIGSAKPELLANKEALAAVTREAITLAEAAGLELPTAATALANALNQFNLPAEESSRVINALAAGSKFGAAAIPELSEAITKFGVAAASSNISIEESIGAVELLAEKGIAGAEAGTKLRNVFGQLDIAKALPPKALKQLAKFGVNTDIVSDSTLTLQERLTELSKIQDDATALTFVFGKQNKVAAQAVLQNVDRIAELTEAVTGTSTAIEQANTNVDNLDGSLKGLSSAYEGLILSIESGEGAFGKAVRSFVDIVTQLFLLISGSKQAEDKLTDLQLAAKRTAESVVKVGKAVTIVVATFLAWKVGLIATALYTKLAALAQVAYTTVMSGTTIATNIATVATKLFNKALRSNPLGLVLAGLTAVVSYLIFFTDETNEATKAQKKLYDILLKTAELRENILSSEEKFAIRNKLSKQGLESLKEDLQSEIFLIQKKADEAKLIVEKESKDLNELKKKFRAVESRVPKEGEVSNEIFKQGIRQQMIIEEERIARLIKLRTGLDSKLFSKKAQLAKKLGVVDDLIAKKFVDSNEDSTKKVIKQKAKEKTPEEIEAERLAKELLAFEKLKEKQLLAFLEAKEKAENEFFESKLEKEEQEIRAVEEKYFNLLEQGKQFNEDALANGEELVADLTQLAEDEQSQIAAIKKKYRDKEAVEEEKRLASLKKQQEEGEARVAKEEEEALARRKEAQQEAVDLSKELVDTVIDNLTTESEAKIESLDRQINAEENFLSQNKNLSAREIEFRREKAAELEAERIEEQKRLEKLAKVQAFFDLVAAFASSGDGQGAIGKAAAAIGAGEAIAQGFHDGGYTGDGNEYKEAGVVHKGEFVNTKAQTTEYGMKGWKAKDFDKAVTDGYFNQFADANIFADQNAKFLSVQNNEVGYDFGRLENELKSVKEAIHNSPTTDFEINGEYFIKRTHRKGGTTTKKRKLG